MTLTRDYIETVNKRVKQDSELAKALLDEVTSLFLALHHCGMIYN